MLQRQNKPAAGQKQINFLGTPNLIVSVMGPPPFTIGLLFWNLNWGFMSDFNNFKHTNSWTLQIQKFKFSQT